VPERADTIESMRSPVLARAGCRPPVTMNGRINHACRTEIIREPLASSGSATGRGGSSLHCGSSGDGEEGDVGYCWESLRDWEIESLYLADANFAAVLVMTIAAAPVSSARLLPNEDSGAGISGLDEPEFGIWVGREENCSKQLCRR